jgi:hypothetical protein
VKICVKTLTFFTTHQSLLNHSIRSCPNPNRINPMHPERSHDADLTTRIIGLAMRVHRRRVPSPVLAPEQAGIAGPVVSCRYWPERQGNRVNKQKFNAKAPGRPRTAKTARTYSHCRTLLATISHPNRQPVCNLKSWRCFFASSRLGVAPLVIHPIAVA